MTAAQIYTGTGESVHTHAATRAAAASALGAIGPKAKAAVPTLIERSRDGDVAVRLAVVQSLGEFGAAAAPAVPALLERLEDESEDVGRYPANNL